MRRIARIGRAAAVTGAVLLLAPTSGQAASGGAVISSAAPLASVLSEPLRLTRLELRSVQRRLGVRADGVLGSGTRASLKRYQRSHRLTVTGRPDVETLRKLGLKVADRYEARLISASLEADPLATLPAADVKVVAALDAARSRTGDPYRSGGTAPGGFDCSGLMVWAFDKAGLELPRTSFQQYRVGMFVPKQRIQAGDLVFFDSAGAGASHVGIATGPTTAISATSKGVQEHSFASGYWANHFLGARRIVAS